MLPAGAGRLIAIAVLLLARAAPARAAPAAPLPPPGTVSLNGQWEFELDKTDSGLTRGFPLRPSFNHTIEVPGISIGAAGFGDATDQKHHEYTGISWFATNITLPQSWGSRDGDENAATVSLRCGGVKNSATFWLDGVAIGNHSGYMDGFELPLPPAFAEAAPTTAR